MNFDFTETQTMVRDTLQRFLADRYDFESRQKISRSDAGWSQDIWKAFAEELGILGASFSEELGGLGGGQIENMIVMEEVGRSLVVEPYLSTVVIGGGFAREYGKADLIEEIIGGETRIAFAWAEPQGRFDLNYLETSAREKDGGFVLSGHKAVVRDAPSATHLVVTARTSGDVADEDGVSLFLLPKDTKGVSTRDYPLVDGGVASEVYFENAEVPASALLGEAGKAAGAVRKVVDEAVVGLCAEAVGCMEQMNKLTQDYTKERKQFGVPISKFQVLQHRMVDMFMEAEQARSMTYMAVNRLPDSASAAQAKVKIGKGLTYVGQNAVQLHGGIGITDEYAVGHYFKRATMIEGQFGTTDHYLRRYERLALED
ncbi:pimeloyl-CoA dehydrogenase small subunit [Pacificimonas flava]|uniref:Pimeloyl-CoA dehydrogenase small subunit n=2 Tax=Pacificimonas TaxID=1960290 RepID=A0A219B636_9SPHN|nr:MULTISPECIES: acyl-CoA dehydrogenase family protein [Pacificimonas]MBZ6379547.1 acyl-CoA dehydrogenase family protein [Pacificimonas aurantium]OWV33269.1 pimeloyl-CoA dehydrogenase small subunit [Pacificimonas flava]